MAFAKCRYPTNLLVDLTNYGSADCKLVSGTVKKGTLYHSRLPEILPATGETYYFALTGLDTEAILSYQCGEYKKFTIHMKQYWKANHIHSSIVGEMLFSADVYETHQDSVTKHKPEPHNGTLSWQFFH